MYQFGSFRSIPVSRSDLFDTNHSLHSTWGWGVADHSSALVSLRYKLKNKIFEFKFLFYFLGFVVPLRSLFIYSLYLSRVILRL